MGRKNESRGTQTHETAVRFKIPRSSFGEKVAPEKLAAAEPVKIAQKPEAPAAATLEERSQKPPRPAEEEKFPRAMSYTEPEGFYQGSKASRAGTMVKSWRESDTAEIKALAKKRIQDLGFAKDVHEMAKEEIKEVERKIMTQRSSSSKLLTKRAKTKQHQKIEALDAKVAEYLKDEDSQ